LQDAPESVIKLLARMLAKDREDRPADPTELRREIEAALRSIGGSAPTSVPATAPRVPAAWPPVVGTTLAGRFDLVEHIGDDRSGRLFRANDRQRSGTPVAVRALRAGLLVTPESRQKFQKTADIITHLQSPAIVSDVACFEADGGRFVTMEWLESRSLMDVLRARGAALPASEVQGIVEGLAGAADAAAGVAR
jgi:serine/threonine protein kinase